MRWRPLLGFGVLIALIAIVVTLRGTSVNDSPEHSSQSDGGQGTSALRYYAQALGHPTGTVEGDFSLPSSHALLFVFTPASGYGYSLTEAQQLQSWIAAGNVVVYAAERSDADLDQQFGLKRTTITVEAAARAAAPLLGGVNTLSGGLEALAFRPGPSQVPLLRNAQGDVLAIRSSIGSGVLIALTDPLVLCNGYLTLADNGRFAADLLAMTPAGGSVMFDEFHHGAVAGGASPAVAWVSTAWGAALTVAVLVIVLGLALRGRAFGPAIPLQPRRDRSTAEYAAAVGQLLHRTGARSITLETLLTATRRTVAERVGLSQDTPPALVAPALVQRAPALAAELTSVEASLSRGLGSEEEVLGVARRLHGLAYPPESATVEGRR
jgi:uncharacterized protein DUF4350